MTAAGQFLLIVAIGLEFGQTNELPGSQVSQSCEIEWPQREPEFAPFQQFTAEPRPAVLWQLVSAQVFVGKIGHWLDGFGRHNGWFLCAPPEDSIEQNCQR